MHKTAIFFISLFLLIYQSPEPAYSNQNTGRGDYPDRLFFENPRKKSVSFNFKLINNLIVIPVSINESDKLHFIVDTGVNTTLITELAIGDSLALQSVRDVRIQGLGEGEPIDAYHSTGNTLEFSGITGDNQEVYVLKEDIFELSSYMGMDINGIFGFNIFRDFIVEINYSRSRLTLHNPELYRYSWWKRTFWNSKPINVVNNKPYVSSSVRKEDGTVVPVRLLIDTGASHSVWLDESSHPEIEAPENSETTLLGAGLSGQVFGRKGRVDALKFGEFELNDVIVSYPDSASIASAIQVDGRNGSMGADVLNRFNVILDYGNEQITFRRNLRYLRPFRHDMSGMTITAPMRDFPLYMVSYVRPGSPAERAGIQEGDQITSVGGSSVSNFTLQELQSLFKAGDGRLVQIEISRDGERMQINLRLERFI